MMLNHPNSESTVVNHTPIRSATLPKPYYQQDGITIYKCDCVEIIPLLPKADLVLTDPPYNVGLAYCDGDNRSDYPQWCESWFRLLPRPVILTPGIVNLSLWLQMERPTWIGAWHKPNQCSSTALGGFNAWEPVLIYGRPRKKLRQDVWSMSIALQPEADGHPCPKFLPFWQRLLLDVTEGKETVLDPFMGSGTTLIAARNLGLKAIGLEIEEKYCDIAATRLSQSMMDFWTTPESENSTIRTPHQNPLLDNLEGCQTDSD